MTSSPEPASAASLPFDAIVEQAPVALIFADREGVIRVWNRAAEAVFGRSAQEAVGESLDLIIPERFRPAHWSGFQRAIADGHTKYKGRAMRTRSVHRNGSKLYVDLSFELVTSASGQEMGALALVRDCTAEYLAANVPGTERANEQPPI
jgi:PAS domain S-box-containing protein